MINVRESFVLFRDQDVSFKHCLSLKRKPRKTKRLMMSKDDVDDEQRKKQ
jgi:hypothetical protein